jgi:psp operon transcriptional activator
LKLSGVDQNKHSGFGGWCMNFIGESPKFIEMLESISLFSKSNRPAFLLGERGTGKELVAQRLHYLSGRGLERLVTINCSAFSTELLNSELFGHEKGAFTGATERREGKISLAHKGTLFLDEISTSSMTFQEQMLRVVEYGQIQRVGGDMPMNVDVRMIAATNENPARLAESQRFRRDLLDRLSFGVIHIPPLRERKDDIPLLAYHFGNLMLRDMGQSGIAEFSEDAMEKLMDYAWPGNIRELKNVVERAVFLAQGGPVDHVEMNPWRHVELKSEVGQAENIEPKMAHAPIQNQQDSIQNQQDLIQNRPDLIPPKVSNRVVLPLDFSEELTKLKIKMLRGALTESRHNQSEAAKLLSLTYAQFRGYLKQYREQLDL